jgi:hypothetical protein
MIADVLLGILLVAITLVLLATLAIQNRIANNIQAATDNVHRIRAGFERERHRFQDAIATVERIEGNVAAYVAAEKRRRPSEF